MKKNGHLLLTTGPQKGLGIPVPESGFRVGRGSANDLIIEDEALSRTHCRFFFRAGQLWVADVNSANGTQVNGQAIDNSPLLTGDRITIGAHELKVLNHAATSGGRAASLRARPPATMPAAPLGLASVIFRRAAWVLLLVWWMLLVYSLCLPPPAGEVEATAGDVPSPVATVPLPVPVSPLTSATPPEITEADAPTVVPTVVPNPLQETEAAVAQHLANEQFAAATQVIMARLDSDHSPEIQNGLRSLADYVAEVRTLNDRVASAIATKAGQRITLHHGGRDVELRVLAVSGSRLHASIIGTNAEHKVTIELTKLSPAERRRWLPPPHTPEEHAMHFVLAFESGTKPAAQTQAQASGRLSEAFLNLLAGLM